VDRGRRSRTTRGAALGWVGASEGAGNLLKDVDYTFLDLGTLRVFFPLAAAALLGAALLAASALRALPSQAVDGRLGRLAIVVALAGAGLSFVALFLPLRSVSEDRHAILREGAVNAPWVALEPVVALVAVGVVAAAGLLALGSDVVRAGLLLALGSLTFLYFLTYVVAVHQHEPGGYGPGGFAGMLGAAAVTAAGILTLRSSERGRSVG
jgi:hypothetical protein